MNLMPLSSGRITTIGFALFTFYFQENLLGYVDLVDGYFCWLEGVPGF